MFCLEGCASKKDERGKKLIIITIIIISKSYIAHVSTNKVLKALSIYILFERLLKEHAALDRSSWFLKSV